MFIHAYFVNSIQGRRLAWKIFSCVLMLGLSTGCSRDDDQFYISDLRNKDQDNGIEIVESPQMQTLTVSDKAIGEGRLSEVLAIHDVIYLDNTVPVGKVNKLMLLNDNLVVFDREITNTLNIFDRNGRHLRTVGQKGEGPGEYAKMHDVQINPYTGRIDVWDGDGQKILSYDETGTLRQERQVDVYAPAFGIVDTSTYLFYQGNNAFEPDLEYKLLAVNVDNQTVEGKLFPLRENEKRFTVQDPGILLNYNAASGKHYFHRLFDDHIYSIQGKRMTVEYAVDFGSRALDYNQINFNQDKNEVIRNWIFNPLYFNMVGDAIETGPYLFFTFNKGTGIVYAFHNRENNSSRYFLNLRNDITGTTIPLPLNADAAGNVYFADEPGMYVETVRSLAQYQNKSEAEILDQWKSEEPLGYEIYQRVSEFDNPIILIGKYIFE